METPSLHPFNTLHLPLFFPSTTPSSLFSIFLSLSPRLPLSAFSFSPSSTMKLIINPKRLFRSKKSRDVSKSDPSSFSYGAASSSSSSSDSSSSSNHGAKKSATGGTPKSVLPSHDSSSDWSDFSSDIYSELVHAFKLIDRDGDGKISRIELEALLNRVGSQPPSQEELATMLSEVDHDGDGSISFEEFGSISSAFGRACDDSELRETFEFFDTDHDGKITAEELFSVFTTIGDERCTLEDCRRMIAGVDKNGDGFVCFEDFTRMMEHQR